ncbi:alanine dehydrogenase [Porticoccus sp. W117]|uniref:alanine dehydrogenase n=1 Tax=Porticoccus sp. W117 TaxID=3054777 RepID=UPI002598BF61|nr:alanine dehydrogenase [Porticoccus sp. W117]MDM3871780.1 alanine dehydrogenase [Porticoccus sp. W117]
MSLPPESQSKSHSSYRTIALAKENESPENPGALEKRVALCPEDVGKLVAAGLDCYVEQGAGEGIGFSDGEYQQQGATLQTGEQIYRDKDMIIKFKGPSLEAIPQMRSGCTLFCMAHFHSYPERARLLAEQRINVLAMEEILENPKHQGDEEILARTAMNAAISPFVESGQLGQMDIRVIQWTPLLAGTIRRGSNRNPGSLKLVQPNCRFEELDASGPNSLYIYDSRTLDDATEVLDKLRACGTHLQDLAEFERNHGAQAIADYRDSHPPLEFGMRRIQCLHETGMAGARYGLKLLRDNKPELELKDAKAVVLGYGNVGQGAIHEIYDQGVTDIAILGREHTRKDNIEAWIAGADLIVNGAEQAPELRGVNYLVSNDHLQRVVPDGSVVIDLIGGSETNRSPVEAVLACTFLTDPHFEQHGVTVSSLWGWPMMGMMRESALRYSGQIADVLLGQERLVDGLDKLTPGVERALVCGKF